MGRKLVFAAAWLALNGLAHAEHFAVPAELWDKPRSGAAIIAQPVLKYTVMTLLDQSGARLLIHHEQREEALLQAEELRAWLSALAVDNTRIELIADGLRGHGLNLELVGITVKEKKSGIERKP